jgi:hypothetical protein
LRIPAATIYAAKAKKVMASARIAGAPGVVDGAMPQLGAQPPQDDRGRHHFNGRVEAEAGQGDRSGLQGGGHGHVPSTTL